MRGGQGGSGAAEGAGVGAREGRGAQLQGAAPSPPPGTRNAPHLVELGCVHRPDVLVRSLHLVQLRIQVAVDLHEVLRALPREVLLSSANRLHLHGCAVFLERAQVQTYRQGRRHAAVGSCGGRRAQAAGGVHVPRNGGVTL